MYRTLAALAVLLVGCGSSPAAADDATMPALDGAYQATSGPTAWLGFRGDEYVTWSSDPSCADPSNAPATCSEHGRFVIDRASKKLILTSDAGKVSEELLEVIATSDAAATQLLHPAIVETGNALVSTAKDYLVTDGFQLVDPKSDETNLFNRITILCKVIGILVHPLPTPVVPSTTTPPAIQRQQCQKG